MSALSLSLRDKEGLSQLERDRERELDYLSCHVWFVFCLYIYLLSFEWLWQQSSNYDKFYEKPNDIVFLFYRLVFVLTSSVANLDSF